MPSELQQTERAAPKATVVVDEVILVFQGRAPVMNSTKISIGKAAGVKKSKTSKYTSFLPLIATK